MESRGQLRRWALTSEFAAEGSACPVREYSRPDFGRSQRKGPAQTRPSLDGLAQSMPWQRQPAESILDVSRHSLHEGRKSLSVRGPASWPAGDDLFKVSEGHRALPTAVGGGLSALGLKRVSGLSAVFTFVCRSPPAEPASLGFIWKKISWHASCSRIRYTGRIP